MASLPDGFRLAHNFKKNKQIIGWLNTQTLGGAKMCVNLWGCLRAKELCVSGERGLPSVSQIWLLHSIAFHLRKQTFVTGVDVKPLVPYDWTKGHEIACDILCLGVTFSVSFHQLFFSPRTPLNPGSIDSSSEGESASNRILRVSPAAFKAFCKSCEWH